MSDLPKLPPDAQRQIDLEWEELLDRRKFRGQHLLLHDQWKAFVEERVRTSLEDRRAHVGLSYRDSLEKVGLLESSALGRERFAQLAEQYLSLWDVSQERTEEFTARLKEIKVIVLDAIVDLWKPEAERFERFLRPRLQAELDSLVDEWTSRARGVELGRLRLSTARTTPLLAESEYQRTLREAEKALERARKLRDHQADEKALEQWRKLFDQQSGDVIDELVRRAAQSGTAAVGPEPVSSNVGGRPPESCEVDIEKVKEIRGRNSVSTFARKCELSRATIERLESTGRASPETIKKIVAEAKKKGFKISEEGLKKRPLKNLNNSRFCS